MLNTTQDVKEQYKNQNNLLSRISIHEKYSVNKQGFGNWLFEQYQLQDSTHLLELGCGNGAMWWENYKKLPTGASLVLSDFSNGMLEAAKSNLPDRSNLSFRQVDIQEIPFDDNSFDIVIANMMLYHVPDLDRGLSEVKRVLKCGGTFYCATYGENGITEYLQDILSEYGVAKDLNWNFTLQNGSTILSGHFAEVEKSLYEDSLEVTNSDDLIEYMLSLTSLAGFPDIPLEELRNTLNSKKIDGKIHVPKEYGVFSSKKLSV